MNDFDKNLLLTELSYGLITRFVFVDIEPDVDREQSSVKEQILQRKTLGVSEQQYDSCQNKITKFYEFINAVRDNRMIGVRTCIDVIGYMVSAHQRNKQDLDDFLDEALCDSLLPQFDRLDKQVISDTIIAAEKYLDTYSDAQFVMRLENMKWQLEQATGWMGEMHDDAEPNDAEKPKEKPSGKNDFGKGSPKRSATAKKAARTRKRNAAAKKKKRKGR